MSEQIKENLAEKEHWMRFLAAVFFALIFVVTASLLGIMTLVQYGILLLTGSKNQNLADFCGKTIQYQTHIAKYATLNSNQKPFPFGPWPGDRDPVVASPVDELKPDGPEADSTAGEPA